MLLALFLLTLMRSSNGQNDAVKYSAPDILQIKKMQNTTKKAKTPTKSNKNTQRSKRRGLFKQQGFI